MKEINSYDEFLQKFRLQELSVSRNDSWVLSVRPGQITLGSMVVSSSKELCRFTELTDEDGMALTHILALAEVTACNLFDAVRINVICLMMVDPIVHFHIIPRYDKPVHRYGVLWEDVDWPGPPAFRNVDTPNNILLALCNELHDTINTR